MATDNFFVVPPPRLLGLCQLSAQYSEMRKDDKKNIKTKTVQKIIKTNSPKSHLKDCPKELHNFQSTRPLIRSKQLTYPRIFACIGRGRIFKEYTKERHKNCCLNISYFSIYYLHADEFVFQPKLKFVSNIVVWKELGWFFLLCRVIVHKTDTPQLVP